MFNHFHTVPTPQLFREAFGVEPPSQAGTGEVWPGYPASFIRLPQSADFDDRTPPQREARIGLFGLIPSWARNTRIGQRSYTACVETVGGHPFFREAWKGWQQCIVPATAICIPRWQGNQLAPMRLSRADGHPMGLAGLWSQWRPLHGRAIYSFALLTLPIIDGGTVVILNEDSYTDWLHATPPQRLEFLRPFPIERLRIDREEPSIPDLAAFAQSSPF